jgi:hypothetical protein
MVMQPIIKLIKPTVSEALLFLTVGASLLFISNYKRFWDFLSNGVSINDVTEQTDNFATALQNSFLNFESHIDPRFADFTVWMIIGAISITTVLFLQHLLEDTTEEIEYTHNITNEKYKVREWTSYLSKAALRVSGLFLLIFILRIYVGAVFSELSDAFFISLANPASIMSWLTIVITIVFSTIGLYAMAICLRLITLRIRVFG